jgi:hypothetical protein
MALRFPIHLLYFSVVTCIPSSHNTWQPRQCEIPSMATRHSKQIPMPQSGPRGSPLTDVRQACPASIIAIATVVPEGTTTGFPFTVTVISLRMRVLLCGSRRQVRFDRNLRFCSGDLIGQDPRRA